MLIQNPKMAGELLTLRYSVNENGDKLVVRGDHEGRFEMPERDAQLLLRTPGWRSPRAPSSLEPDAPAPRLAPAVPVASAPKPPIRPPAPVGMAPRIAPVRPAETTPAPAAEPKGKTAEEEAEEAAEQLAEEIGGLRTKADAVAFAELHGVKGITEEMKLSEMKEALEKALIESDDEPADGGTTEG